MNGDKIKTLKIILSLCFKNISDGDKIPINIIFGWGQEREIENFLVPMLSKYSNGDKIPIEMFFEWGQDKNFENYLVLMLCKNF